jgi:hypothetical protein
MTKCAQCFAVLVLRLAACGEPNAARKQQLQTTIQQLEAKHGLQSQQLLVAQQSAA